MVQVWNGKRLVVTVSAIHKSEHVNTMKENGKANDMSKPTKQQNTISRYGKTNEETNKPHCALEHNQYVRSADQFFSCSNARETVKWYKKVV